VETDKRAHIGARLSLLEKLRAEIDESLSRLEEYVSKTAPLRALSALFNAENDMRLDLETYAISAMFDHVLRSANQRLAPMTNGRYLLERDDGVGGRSRRGLGIRVFDFHTGKPRSPSTLSGGETFIAALALALGLSDVVESVNGKVHLDTIFIDEGFGSLDTENESGTLDQVLQVLTNLVGQRRSVGLISHVQLVQEAIPNGFYVRKELHGSRVEVHAPQVLFEWSRRHPRGVVVLSAKGPCPRNVAVDLEGLDAPVVDHCVPLRSEEGEVERRF
jgi:exonuclease SbcC